MPIKEDVKAKWVQALRSGEYEQTQRYLCDDGAYCALGVLAKVTEGSVTTAEDYEYNDLFPRLGLEEQDYAEVWQRNDAYLWPFDKIADWIEQGGLDDAKD